MFLQSYLSDNDYIAAQSPMESTVDDVWQLIWQFRCGIVVTIGDCEEDGEVCACMCALVCVSVCICVHACVCVYESVCMCVHVCVFV